MSDIIEEVVIPEHPSVNVTQPITVYIPTASISQKGIASFDNASFTVLDGKVSIDANLLKSLKVGNFTVIDGYLNLMLENGGGFSLPLNKLIQDDSISKDKLNDELLEYIDSKSKTGVKSLGIIYDKNLGKHFLAVERLDGAISRIELDLLVRDGTINEGKLAEDVQGKLNASIKNIDYLNESGDLKITYNNDSTTTLSLPLELLLAEEGSYFDVNSKDLVLVLANGQSIKIPLDAIVDTLSGSIKDLDDTKFDKFLNADGEYENQIVAEQIKDGVITESKIDTGAVTNDKIADSAIVTEKLHTDVKDKLKRVVKSIYTEGDYWFDSLGNMEYRTDLVIKCDNYEARVDTKDIVGSIGTSQIQRKAVTIDKISDELKNDINKIEKFERRIELLEGLTIKTVTDASVAHKKIVPIGAAPNAVVNKLGGRCMVLPGDSHNLCTKDEPYTLDNVEHIDIYLGTYPEGHYYISANENLTGVGDLYCPEIPSAYLIKEGIYFELNGVTELKLSISSFYEMSGGEEGDKINGTIENFLICKPEDAAKGYKPYAKSKLVFAKPTRIESRKSGNNLCSVDGTIEFKGEERHTFSLGYYDAGTYYLSFNNDTGIYYWTAFANGDRVVGDIYGASATFTISTRSRVEVEAYSLSWASGGEEEGYLFGKPQIMLCKADETDKTYKPYGPGDIIETLVLPEAVLTECKGWGLSINSEYNHFEVRDGRIIYIQKFDAVDLGDFNWSVFSTQYFATYPEKSPDLWATVDLAKCTGYERGVGVCANYKMQPAYNISQNNGPDKSIGYVNPNTTHGYVIYVRDNGYSNAWEFKQAVKGEKFVYPLSKPKETDITHLFPDFEGHLDIKTEHAGSLIFVNEDNSTLSVPSTITYITKA